MSHELGRWRHLGRRLFDVAGSRPLTPDEERVVDDLLGEGLLALFRSQPVPDQRHGLEMALAVLDAAPGRPDLARASLLHDVGKRHAALTTWGRSVVAILTKLRIPVWGRLALYNQHGELGAGDLEAAGAEPLVCDFARHHHARRPDRFPHGDWALLVEADQA